MLHAGDGPRRNARTILQTLRRDARQRRAAYLISRALPRPPRHAQHRALAGPGVTHADAQTPAIGRMVERCALLARQRQPARLRAGQSRLARLLVGSVPLPLGITFRSALQPLFGHVHLATREPNLTAPLLAEFAKVWRPVH